jgi:hypothetical protein
MRMQLLYLRIFPAYHPFSHTNAYLDMAAAHPHTTPDQDAPA